MGEAKRRKQMREEALKVCKQLSPARFNHYAIGARLSLARYMCEELSYWASHDERIISLIGNERGHNNYFWVILARDQNGCFRWVDEHLGFSSKRRAEDALLEEIKRIINSGKDDIYGHQGDETNAPVNLLKLPTDFDSETLHPYYRTILEMPYCEPARAVLKEIGPWLAPEDPHLVKEFQTNGFEQRLWEIYLWAALRDFNLDLDLLEAPDFLCTGPGIDFCIEATTVAPSKDGALADYPKTSTDEEKRNFINEYMPMKFGSALYSKLTKPSKDGRHYWERKQSKDKPFLLAIADFHKPTEKNEIGTMTYTQMALWQYLYGSRIYWDMEDGKPIVKQEAIMGHQYKDKEIPSGFFDLPKAENISAILFSNAGTISKFNRMGVVAGFGADNCHYFRTGLRHDPDPNAIIGQPFSEEVLTEGYEEYWSDEIQVFHNPNAVNPLPLDWLIGATHHCYEDGSFETYAPDGRVLTSHTIVLQSDASKK